MEFAKYRCMLVKEDTVPYEASGKIKNSEDVYEVIKSLGYDTQSEEYVCLFTMDVKGRIIGLHEISHGGLCCSYFAAKDVFKRAFLDNAYAIILFHNHPSGSLVISDEDVAVTKKMVNAGKFFGCQLQDHIIVSLDGYISIREERWDIFNSCQLQQKERVETLEE